MALRQVLVADDDLVDQMAFARLVRSAALPIECTWADSVAEAREALSAGKFDAAVLDYWLGDGSALDLLPDLDGVPTLVVAGTADPDIVAELRRAGVVEFLVKDVGPEYDRRLVRALQTALDLPPVASLPDERRPPAAPVPPPALPELSAEAARRELHEFAYLVSHDLKAPLRGVVTLTELLCAEQGAALGQSGQDRLAMLRRRAERVIALVDRVHEYAVLTRDLRPGRVDLADLVPEVIRSLAPRAGVEVGVEGRLPAVWGDRDRLRKLFEHLLGNAVKFLDKPRGEVRVRASREAAGWRISVADNGPGIEARFFETIFQPCKTLQTQEAMEGSGMGLTLARKIAELHGGRLWVESEVGQGSTFHVTLPAG
ncbi:MAG: ATP-binding protein [Candidatus Methylomirabilales bacterium]